MIDERIKLIKGDITLLSVDAIVNAANSTLLGGGGVDGAIHRAAGNELLDECKGLNGCSTGEAKITKGYKLSAKHVIHTVGPVWRGGNNDEDMLLRNCYFNSLKLAVDNNLASVAFPSISTGVYGFPFIRASEIALSTVNDFLYENESLEDVFFVTFSENDYENFRLLLDEASID